MFCIFTLGARGQDTIVISEDLYLLQLSEHSYIHTSFHGDPQWGRFASNGFIYTANDSVILFDTPISPELTSTLLRWVEDSLGMLVAFVPNHWHNDCSGGIEVVKASGARLIGHQFTSLKLQEQGLIALDEVFHDSLRLRLGGQSLICRYFGPAHSEDNIVLWLPDERILFGGCMLKSLVARSLGNTVDADISQWPLTVQKVQEAHPRVAVVIPGHGDFGDHRLLAHTLTLIRMHAEVR